MPKADKSLVGIHNKEAVINTIRDNSPIFRAEIARLTGLSIPTVEKQKTKDNLKTYFYDILFIITN